MTPRRALNVFCDTQMARIKAGLTVGVAKPKPVNLGRAMKPYHGRSRQQRTYRLNLLQRFWEGL